MISFKKSPFLKSVLLLSSGSFLAQAITALSTPVLTRLFSPEIMGQYTYIISVTAVFISVINLRYDVCIITEKDEANVFPLIKLCLIIGFCITIIGSMSFYSYFLVSGKALWMSLYVFIILLSFAIIDVFTAYNNRCKEYKIISSVYIFRTSVQNILSILGGLVFSSVHMLAVPYALGQFAGITRQVKPLKAHLREIMRIPWEEVKRVAILHKRQPFFSAPALLANSLSYSLITIIMESLYGLQEVGYYSVSVRLLGIPLALIGTNVSKVYVEQASKEYNAEGCYRKTFNKTFLLLLIIAIPMVLCMLLFSIPLCALVLGNEWSVAGQFIMVLAPMFGVRFITSALSPSFVILGKQKIELWLQCLFLISCLICYSLSLYYAWTVFEFLKLLSLLYTLSYSVYLIFIFLFSKKQKQNQYESKKNCNIKCRKY